MIINGFYQPAWVNFNEILNTEDQISVLTDETILASVNKSLLSSIMKFDTFKKVICSLAALGLVTFFGTSCGNTMYGMGLDMERTGRKLQTNHDPIAVGSGPQGGGYQQPYTPNPYGYYSR